MKIYTGIGSRETPEEVLHAMKQIAIKLAKEGWTLRSGHAEGADTAFEQGAFEAEGKMEIYLPWKGFNGAYHNGHNYFVMHDPKAMEMAAQFHPAWHKCTPGAKKLHARNVHQVLGFDLNTPSNLIICWTKDGKRQGGTGQALRIAEYYNIPIIDLAINDAMHQLENFLSHFRDPKD